MSVQNHTCSICRDEDSVAPFAAVSGPDHLDPHHFHFDCIHPWIDQRLFTDFREAECPLCRRSIQQVTFYDNDSNHTEIRLPLIRTYNLIIAIITQDDARLARAARRSIIPNYISPVDLASAVRFGILYENLPAIQIVLERGQVDPAAFPSLLNRAVERGNRDSVELILQHGAPFSFSARMDAASTAIRLGNYWLSYRLCPDIIRNPLTFTVIACSTFSLQHMLQNMASSS